MCAALCWMLQAWVPPGWALFGALLAVLRLAAFSYWIDTYTGGAVSAIGGALVLGALPRILRRFRARDFFWMALGLAILVNSRPYEGFLVSLPSLAVLAWRLWRDAQPSIRVLIRRAAPAAVLLASTVGFMGYYNYRVFGNPRTLPYMINRAQYASAPHFLFQSAHPEPAYRHTALRNFYTGWELKTFREEKASLSGFAGGLAKKILAAGSFYTGFALLPLLLGLPWALRRGKNRILTATLGLLGFGLLIETFFIPHYLAPATALLLVLLLESMRRLRASGPRGLFLVRAIPAICVILAGVRIFAAPLRIALPDELYETGTWAGGAPTQTRAGIQAELQRQPGGQLAIVRYTPEHLYPEWVYNGAEIDHSKVVWAREMDAASNRELLDHYKDRTAWLVEPDAKPPRVTLYPEPGGATEAAESAVASAHP